MSQRIENADLGYSVLTDEEAMRVVGGESWAYSADPTVRSFSYQLAALPLTGASKSVPVAGSYWGS